jgi:hypothetical protein
MINQEVAVRHDFLRRVFPLFDIWRDWARGEALQKMSDRMAAENQRYMEQYVKLFLCCFSFFFSLK